MNRDVWRDLLVASDEPQEKKVNRSQGLNNYLRDLAKTAASLFYRRLYVIYNEEISLYIHHI